MPLIRLFSPSFAFLGIATKPLVRPAETAAASPALCGRPGSRWSREGEALASIFVEGSPQPCGSQGGGEGPFLGPFPDPPNPQRALKYICAALLPAWYTGNGPY